MVVLAHLQQGVVATFRGQVGTTIVDHSVKVGASHPPSPLLPLTLTDIAPTDLTAAAALVRKAYSKRRRLRLWSKPVNLRGRDDSCQAPLCDGTATGLFADRELREIRYGVVVHTRENSPEKRDMGMIYKK
jgi:hypothetical protein